MAGGRQSQKLCLRQARQAATVTHISSLPDDILLQIFLRLPSLATLVRAACTCPAWRRAVASSPAFRSRFGALHPAPLVGFFTGDKHNGLPDFAAAHGRFDKDVLAVLRGGDFDLTSLIMEECDDHVPLQWRVLDCRDGYLLMKNSITDQLATVNPLARQGPDYIDMPPKSDISAEQRGKLFSLDPHLLSSDEDPMSFRLVWLFHDAFRVRAVVFASDTWDWHVLPWTEVTARMPPLQQEEEEDDDDRAEWLQHGTQANGLVHLPFTYLDLVLTLDTKTMEFSVWELPPPLCSTPRSLVVGETKDGTPCIVRASGFSITVWMRRGGADENWEYFKDSLFYNEEPELLGHVCRTTDMTLMNGFVYLVTTESILSLCLKTWNLDKLFPCSYGGEIYPSFMAWPPSLVGNYGSFANCSSATQDGDSISSKP
ncbi:hypothetical protein EJB05_54825, partial [Eragrostis curvula]